VGKIKYCAAALLLLPAWAWALDRQGIKEKSRTIMKIEDRNTIVDDWWATWLSKYQEKVKNC
jgi:hypothetical protein